MYRFEAAHVGRGAPAAALSLSASAESSGLFRNAEAAEPLGTQPLCMLAVDAEEDFDWAQPVPGTAGDTRCMHSLGDLQSILGAYGARPAYLLTYPVMQDEEAVRSLRRYRERDACTLGVQLHSWVTPPVEGAADVAASYQGNLGCNLEERKLLALVGAFQDRFGERPTVFRAGRYGMGTGTAALLERHGFTVDVSLAPRTRFTREGGPDFSGFDCAPFWFGEQRRLLEVPLCRSIVGWGGRAAHAVYQRLAAAPAPDSARGQRATALLTMLRAAERITLSPEGNDVAAVRRLVRHLLARGQRLLTISFHSSSLHLGRSPYVRSRRDLHLFYDRLSAMLSLLANDAGCQFADLPALPGMMRVAPAGPREPR